MEFDTESQDSTLIVMAEGRVDGANAREFHESLESVLGPDHRAMILDLEALSYISSAGLRVVLLVARTLQQQRGRLVVCSLPGPIRELFEISGFDKIIDVYASRANALAGLGDN